VKLYGFCLSIAYIARRHHPYTHTHSIPTSSGLTVFSSVSTAPRLLRFLQGGLVTVLCLHVKSEGLGKPAE